eukprot:scaffold162919_cov35-Prasinocladus_malaysianus.AAC.1
MEINVRNQPRIKVWQDRANLGRYLFGRLPVPSRHWPMRPSALEPLAPPLTRGRQGNLLQHRHSAVVGVPEGAILELQHVRKAVRGAFSGRIGLHTGHKMINTEII